MIAEIRRMSLISPFMRLSYILNNNALHAIVSPLSLMPCFPRHSVQCHSSFSFLSPSWCNHLLHPSDVIMLLGTHLESQQPQQSNLLQNLTMTIMANRRITNTTITIMATSI